MKIIHNIQILDDEGQVISREKIVQEISKHWFVPSKSLNPKRFRQKNIQNIDSLSILLEEIGFEIIKRIFPDLNKETYYIYFHPLVNDNFLRAIDNDSLRRKYKKEKNTSRPSETFFGYSCRNGTEI